MRNLLEHLGYSIRGDTCKHMDFALKQGHPRTETTVISAPFIAYLFQPYDLRLRHCPLLHRPLSFYTLSPPHSNPMADLYPPSYQNRHHQQYHRHPDHYPHISYSSQPVPGSASSNDSSEDVQEPPTAKAVDSQPATKSESKPQATFLTKLYAYVLLSFNCGGVKLTRSPQSS